MWKIVVLGLCLALGAWMYSSAATDAAKVVAQVHARQQQEQQLLNSVTR